MSTAMETRVEMPVIQQQRPRAPLNRRIVWEYKRPVLLLQLPGAHHRTKWKTNTVQVGEFCGVPLDVRCYAAELNAKQYDVGSPSKVSVRSLAHLRCGRHVQVPVSDVDLRADVFPEGLEGFPL